MTTAYPGGIDNFANPTASDTLNSNTVPHASQHANANDAIEAIETALGTNPKGDAASVSARIGALETTVDTPTTGLVDLVDGLDITVNATTTGLVDRVDALETGLGDSPFGENLALDIYQSTAAATLAVGSGSGEVDDSAPVVWYKFKIAGVDYAVPGYTINS